MADPPRIRPLPPRSGSHPARTRPACDRAAHDRREPRRGPIALKLALTAYRVGLAIFIPMSGWMADRFGARTVCRAALAVFMAGSLACAAADGLLGFVAAGVPGRN